MKLTRGSKQLLFSHGMGTSCKPHNFDSMHSSQCSESSPHVTHALHSGRKHKVVTNSPSNAKEKALIHITGGI